jgi:hypothetical protein
METIYLSEKLASIDEHTRRRNSGKYHHHHHHRRRRRCCRHRHNRHGNLKSQLTVLSFRSETN